MVADSCLPPVLIAAGVCWVQVLSTPLAYLLTRIAEHPPLTTTASSPIKAASRHSRYHLNNNNFFNNSMWRGLWIDRTRYSFSRLLNYPIFIYLFQINHFCWATRAKKQLHSPPYIQYPFSFTIGSSKDRLWHKKLGQTARSYDKYQLLDSLKKDEVI